MNKLFKFILAIIAISLVLTTISPITKALDPNNTPKNTSEKEIITLIPFKSLEELLNNKENFVYVPYQKIKELLNKKDYVKEDIPLDYAVKSLSVNLTASDTFVSGLATYDIDILSDKWVKIPLLENQVALKSISLDGQSVPLGKESGNYVIISKNKGSHKLIATFDKKITETGNTKNLSLDIQPVSITKVSLTVKDPQANITLRNASGITIKKEKDSKTVTGNISGNSNISAIWQTRVADIKKPQITDETKPLPDKEKPTKILAEILSLFSFSESALYGESALNLQVYHAPIDKITLDIPDDVKITEIYSTQNIVRKGVPEVYDPNPKSPGKKLTVNFVSKVKGDVSFTISYEKNLNFKEKQILLPAISFDEGSIQNINGYVAIRGDSNLEISPVKSTNISRIDIEELPYSLKQNTNLLMAYTYFDNSKKREENKLYTLELEVIKARQNAPMLLAVIDNVSIDSRMYNNGELNVQVDYTIRNRSESNLKLKLPKDAELEVIYVKGERIIPQEESSTEGDLSKRYLVGIKDKNDNQPFVISVIYKKKYNFIKLISSFLSFYQVQAPEVENIPVLTLQWKSYVPEKMRYWDFTGLKEGQRNYASYLQNNYKYFVSGDGIDDKVQRQEIAQMSNMAPEPGALLDGKVAGIIPPEYKRPELKGLKLFYYSDYLLNTGMPSIKILAVTSFINIILFILALIAAFKGCKLVHKTLNPEFNIKERAKIIITTGVILYLLISLFGEPMIAGTIISVIAYISTVVYNNNFPSLSKLRKKL